MSIHYTASAHSGRSVTLMDLDPRFGIICAAITGAGDRCTSRARYVSEAAAPVCGTHTEPGQKIDYDQVRALA